jgi:SNF2 family DNA or RNA helicase
MQLQNYRFKNEPMAHQAAYLSRFWLDPNVAVFAEMGTGKSYMAINNIAMLYDNGKINGALILAPKGVYRNWMALEIPKHMPEHIACNIALWGGKGKETTKKFEDLFAVDDHLHILIMNTEALQYPSSSAHVFATRFVLAHSAIIVVDESTMIKNPKANRTKVVTKVGSYAKYRRILTGSPVTRSPLDLYSQCGFLDYELLGYESYFAFQMRYAVMVKRKAAGGQREFHQIVGYRHLDELTEKLKQFSFRVTKDECLDLPEKVYAFREVELTEEQERAYKQMKKMALSVMDDGSMVSTATALTQLLRLHQIVCGHVKTDDGNVQTLPSNRIGALMDCIEETSGKVIIWSNFTQDLEDIYVELSKKYGGGCAAKYYGETSGEDRQKIVEQFQDPNSQLRFFIGQARTGGYGLTLTEAGTVIYFSNSFDLEKRLQSEDRAHRIGQTKSVTYVDLVARGTIDERIVEALRNKIDIATQVMGEDIRKWLI